MPISLPAYDIDVADGEIDEVYFNGHKLDKPLQGTDGTWYENQFSVPIEWVKFPSERGTVGSGGNMRKPAAADNLIWIDIDTRAEGWCTAIDWAQVHFKAMAPLLLIHGTGANPQAAWEEEPGITDYLTSLGIPFEHKIQLVPSGRIETNAVKLKEQIANIAKSFGVQNVHLVGHSKGGLDSRRYLSTYYNPEAVRVLSLQTLSTPHQGTVFADISYIRRQLDLLGVQAQDGDDEMLTYLDGDDFVASVGWLFQQGSQRPDIDDLRTEAMRAFNSSNSFRSDIKFYTYGADADLPPHGDGNISVGEAIPLIPNISGFIDAGVAGTAQYHILRDVSIVKLRKITGSLGIVIKKEFERVPTTAPQLNDLVVTDNSSKHPSQLQHFGPDPSDPSKLWLQRNHRNFKNPETMNRVLEQIRRDFPVN
jgi:pimeloyl-ACP methyl ester carboxylesterase